MLIHDIMRKPELVALCSIPLFATLLVATLRQMGKFHTVVQTSLSGIWVLRYLRNVTKKPSARDYR